METFCTGWRMTTSRPSLPFTGGIGNPFLAPPFGSSGTKRTRKTAEAGAPASPELLLRVKEVQQLIQTVIGNMPPKMREVYQLSRQEHLTHREIAERLAISEETVKKHIQNALQLLRSAMGKAPASIPALLFYLLS